MNRLGIVAPILALTLFGCAAPAPEAQPAAPSTTAQPRATVARPTSTPTPVAEPTETTPAYEPSNDDFQVSLKILQKKCFGSAGCNITYRIKPVYAGTQELPETGTIEVSYRVRGGDSGPADNTFTVSGGQVEYEPEEDISTKSSSTKLKVEVTEVTYSES